MSPSNEDASVAVIWIGDAQSTYLLNLGSPPSEERSKDEPFIP